MDFYGLAFLQAQTKINMFSLIQGHENVFEHISFYGLAYF